MNFFELLLIWSIPAAFIAMTAALLCKGDKFTAFMMCFLFGPFGVLLLMAIEYAHTMPTVSAPKPPKIRHCRKCKLQLSTNAKECPGCKYPVQPV